MIYAAFYLLITWGGDPVLGGRAAEPIPMPTIAACQLARTVVLQDEKTNARAAICLPGGA